MTQAQAAVLDQAVVQVPVRELKTYPKNPRKGNIDAVAESLKENGQFRPLIVQRSTNYILGGNHTFLAAKQLKWKTVAVAYVDCDDDRAKRIVLADNRTSDLAGYDSEVLAEILDSIEMPQTGTGYNADDIKSILAAVDERDAELFTQAIYKPPTVTFSDDDEDDEDFDDRIDKLKDRQSKLTGKDISTEARLEEESSKVTDEDRRMAELQAKLTLLVDDGYRSFKSSNYWGIPDLRRDMLVDSLPDKIDTWGGKDATPDDGASTWVYNFGAVSPSGIPWDRTILSFFTYDTKFESWITDPDYQAAKHYTKGARMGIVPDSSFWIDEPRIRHLISLHDSMFTARIMQEAGIKMIPRLIWCDLESIKYSILGVPLKPPVAAMCIQNVTDQVMEETQADIGLREIVKVVKPECLLFYSGPPGRRLLEKANLPKSLHVITLDNVAAKRRNVVYDKPDGLKAVQAAERKAKRGKKKADNPQPDGEGREDRHVLVVDEED